jgi:hypothetical protein
MTIRELLAKTPCAFALVASLAAAGQASASVHNLTYKGVVTSASDGSGEFGVGAVLVGQAFTANVVYDDAKAGASYIGNGYTDAYYGNGAANPVFATILLNGVMRSFGATSGYDYRQDNNLRPDCVDDCTLASFQQHAEDRFTQSGTYTLNYINLGGSSTDGSIFGLAHTPPDFTNPPVELYAFVSLFQQDVVTLASRVNTSVFVRIDSVTGAVPEPGAWALMLMGFGGLGGLLRRRRSQVLLGAADA